MKNNVTMAENNNYARGRHSLPAISLHHIDAVHPKNARTVEEQMAYKMRKEELKPHMSDLFLKTEVHGLPDLYESYKQRRAISVIVWLVVVVVATSLLVWQIYETWSDFQDNPVLSTYSVIHDPNGIEFASIYICPQQPIHLQNLKESNVDKQWYKDNALGIFQLKGYDGLTGVLAAKSRVSKTLVDVVAGFGQSVQELCVGPTCRPKEWVPKDVAEFYMKVGYKTDTLFEECAWASHSFNCSEHITEVFDGDYGKCFYIDNTNLKQTVSGSGMSLVLNLDAENAYGTDMDFGVSPPIFDGVSLKVCANFVIYNYTTFFADSQR
jgi:hypothetical protein